MSTNFVSSRRSRIYILLLTAMLALGSFFVSAQGSVPVNGNMLGSMAGWGNRGNSTWVVGGHNGAGAIKLTASYDYNKGFVSQPFDVVSSPSVLSYWTYGDNCGGWSAYQIEAFDGSGLSSVVQVPYLNNTWQQVTATLSSYIGSTVAVRFMDSACVDLPISDVSVTGAQNSTKFGGQFINGAFRDLWRWIPYPNSDYTTFDAAVGHNAVGSVKFGSGTIWQYVKSHPFLVDNSSWSLWLRGDSNQSNVGVRVYVMDYTTGLLWSSVLDSSGNDLSSTNWVQKTFSLSSYSGDYVALYVGTYSDMSGFTWLDDVCDSAGCVVGTPTPTVPPTATNWWTGTPPIPVIIPTIQFPTQIPYPTYPPFPTAAPYPTVDNGWATPYVVVVTNTVEITGHVTVMNWPTPIYGPGTPVPVYQPTRPYTPVAIPTNPFGQGGIGNPVPVKTYDTFAYSGRMPFSVVPRATIVPPGAKVIEETLPLCLVPGVGQVIAGIPICYNFTIWDITDFEFMGVNLMPPLSAILLVLLFVAVVRMFQAH